MPGITSPSFVAACLVFGLAFFNEAVFREQDLENFRFDWQVALRLVLCGACGVFGIWHLPRTLPRLLEFPYFLSLAFCGWGLFIVPLAVNSRFSFGAVGVLTAVTLAVPAIALHTRPRTVYLAILAALTTYLVGSWLAYFLAPGLGRLEDPTGGGMRFGGLNHPNTTGCLLALLATMATGAYVRQWLTASSAGALVVASLVTIVATDSRTALISAVLGVGWVVVRHWRIPLVFVGFAAALLIAILSINTNVRSVSKFSRSGDAEEISSFSGRTILWEFCLTKAAESPWRGYGYGCERMITVDNEWSTYNAHNVLLNVLLSTGIVGGAMVGAMFLFQVRRMVMSPDVLLDSLIVVSSVAGLTHLTMYTPMPGAFTLVWLFVQLWNPGELDLAPSDDEEGEAAIRLDDPPEGEPPGAAELSDDSTQLSSPRDDNGPVRVP